MSDDKILPLDSDSDDSLPGRIAESSVGSFPTEESKPKSNNKLIIIAMVSFVIVFAGVLSYYTINQNEIDSQIIENMSNLSPDERLAKKFNVGNYNSDHAHAAIMILVDGKQVNFGMQEFQVTSKYIHFENHNPHTIHKHATGVPLEMLFASMSIDITADCVNLNYSIDGIKTGKFCQEGEKTLVVFLNGEQFYADITQYEISHNDRVMISIGDSKSISKNLKYLESLDIANVPKKTPQFSGNGISI
jgi:hypothetical protein